MSNEVKLVVVFDQMAFLFEYSHDQLKKDHSLNEKAATAWLAENTNDGCLGQVGIETLLLLYAKAQKEGLKDEDIEQMRLAAGHTLISALDENRISSVARTGGGHGVLVTEERGGDFRSVSTPEEFQWAVQGTIKDKGGIIKLVDRGSEEERELLKYQKEMVN